jgi:hypothetical protein
VSPAAQDTLPVCVDCLAAEVDADTALAMAWQSDEHGWHCSACAAGVKSAARSTRPDSEWSWPTVSSGVHSVLHSTQRALADERSGEHAIDPDPRERPTVPVPGDDTK